MTQHRLATLLAWVGLSLSATLALAADSPKVLPGTQPLTIAEPLDEVMVAGINRFALEALAASPQQRAELWQAALADAATRVNKLDELRARFRTIIGAVDERVAEPDIELVATLEQDSVVAKAAGYVVHSVRWPVMEGVTAEGLLLQPKGEVRARVIALPDADWTPEMFAGVVAGAEGTSPMPRLLAENGIQVLVPTLINRDDTFSGRPHIRFTNQPHREFVYRMAFEMGRHVIGYEVQKVLAGVDIFERLNRASGADVPIGVCGVGEGGLLALYSAAVEPRIDVVLVSGYFSKREGVWEEPIYRNVWSLLTQFGDAEIAALVAPRTLIVEACTVPTVYGPPAPRDGRSGAAPGKIQIAAIEDVKQEFDRGARYCRTLGTEQSLQLVASDNGRGPAGSPPALALFARGLGLESGLAAHSASPEVRSDIASADFNERQRRQFEELVEFTQRLYRKSARARDDFWKQADRSSVDKWQTSKEHYRDYVWNQMFGKLPPATLPPNVRTRLVLEYKAYRGYDVVLDVYPNVIASGILLLPSDLKPDEKRPVVVCQHGLEGTPMHTITRDDGYSAYKSFSVELAKRGFIVYAPQNPYRGQDEFRTIQRKSNPMQRSLFSYIIRQHEQTLDWLKTLPNVDPERIAFYGLSYGGKTAVRVPPMLDDYCLSICSADYDEWVLKNVSSEDRYSYIFTGEYEMFEWNLGHVANYAELASLMAPRPFMVERGHDDGVAPDEWVAWEYSKVRRHYDQLGIGANTEIEFFNGPHTINGQGTFAFLHKHLKWPER